MWVLERVHYDHNNESHLYDEHTYVIGISKSKKDAISLAKLYFNVDSIELDYKKNGLFETCSFSDVRRYQPGGYESGIFVRATFMPINSLQCCCYQEEDFEEEE